MESRMKKCVLAVALAGLPVWAGAASLGKLNVLSGLGQPLRAEIDLVSVQGNELETMAVGLAPVEDYRDSQVDYPPTSLGLRFQIEKRANGQPYVLVASRSLLSEPFLDILLELKWESGRVLREYTALLDPVGYAPAKAVLPQAASSKPAVKPLPAPEAKPVAPAPVSESKPAPVAKTESRPAAKPAAKEETGDTHTVKAGETLAGIAQHYKPDDVTLEQMLVGLYHANQGAFEGGNMNRLKRGRILNVPAAAEIAAVGPQQAAKEVRMQAADWRSYRSKLAAAVQQQPATEGEKSAASGKIVAKVEDKGLTAATPQQDSLKLSKGSQEAKNLQQKIQAMEEEASSRSKALSESTQRVADLEKQIKDMQKLLELKSKTGSELQTQAEKNKLAKAEAKPEAAKPAAKATEKPSEKPVEKAAEKAAAASKPAAPGALPPLESLKPVAPAPVAPTAAKPAAPAPAAPAEPAKPVQAAPVAPPPVATPAAPVEQAPKPKKKPVVVSAPEPEEPGLLADPLVLGGGGLALAALLGGGIVYYMRRRKKPTFEDSIITGSDLKSNTVLGNTGGAVISTGATENSFLTDFSREGLGNIDTDEVDPIAEAEVYMAYGRDAQAEEILKDALSKDATRQEVRLKLLEIYAARKNLTTFEAVATEMYEALAGKGALWEQAAEMGRTIDPDNPLYARPVQDSGSGLDKTMVMAGSVAMVAAAAAATIDTRAQAEAPAATLDFDLPEVVEKPAAAPAEKLDFDLGMDFGLEQPAAEIVPASVEAVKAEAVQSLDFDLGDFGDFAEPAEEKPQAMTDDAVLSLDIPLDMPEIAAPTEAAMLDLELGNSDFNLEMPAEQPQAEPAVAELALDSALDFDFNLETAASSEALSAADAPDLDLHGIDLELGSDFTIEPVSSAPAVEDDFGMDFAADIEDPVATKLDLARAYMEMGDKEGAREILQEALAEGNSSQQETAKAMLAEV